MVHHGEGLALGLEAGHDFLGVHAELDELQSNAAFHRLALFGHIHAAETAFADFFQELVAANHGAEFFFVGDGDANGGGGTA